MNPSLPFSLSRAIPKLAKKKKIKMFIGLDPDFSVWTTCEHDVNVWWESWCVDGHTNMDTTCWQLFFYKYTLHMCVSCVCDTAQLHDKSGWVTSWDLWLVEYIPPENLLVTCILIHLLTVCISDLNNLSSFPCQKMVAWSSWLLLSLNSVIKS